MTAKVFEFRYRDRIDQAAPNGCWVWTGWRDNVGRAIVWYPGSQGTGKKPRLVRAARLVWEMQHGPIPDGLAILHRCDNRACVNPEHLFIGTQAENMADMVAKRRQARGERNGVSKLTEAQVLEIHALKAQGLTHTQLARRFGVAHHTIRALLSGVTWKHVVTAPPPLA